MASKTTNKKKTNNTKTKNKPKKVEVIEEVIEEEVVEEIEEKPKKKKKKEEVKEEKKPNAIMSFLNNPLPIFLVQTLIIIVMIVAYINLRSSIAMYNGHVEDENVMIGNIHYFLNNDMNYFHASSATFTGEEKQVYSYNVGYYVEDDNGELIEFISRSNKVEAPVSLTAAVQDMSGWSFGESSYQRRFFTNEVVKHMDKLHFVISASTEKGSDKADVYYDIKVSPTKISK